MMTQPWNWRTGSLAHLHNMIMYISNTLWFFYDKFGMRTFGPF